MMTTSHALEDKYNAEDDAKKISKHADILELGFPHNTPIADGGQIQGSSHRALKKGIKLKDVFNIVKELNTKEGVSILLAEQNTNVALKNSDYGYIIETGRVMLDGTAKSLLSNDQVKELYLGISKKGRKNFRDVLKEESLTKKRIN